MRSRAILVGVQRAVHLLLVKSLPAYGAAVDISWPLRLLRDVRRIRGILGMAVDGATFSGPVEVNSTA